MKLPVHISADRDWTSNFLHIGFFCQDFFSLLAEALDTGHGQLLDPLVQLLGEYLLVHDVTCLNWLLLLAPPAGTRFPGLVVARHWRWPSGSSLCAQPLAAALLHSL